MTITEHPILFCILALLCYPAGAILGFILDKIIAAIWPPKPPPAATRRFHIRKV